MAASITDLISKVTSSTYAAPTTVQTARSSGTTSLLCNALTGWDTSTAQFFLTYRLNGSGALVAGTECAWVGTVSGNTISSLTLTAGTDTGNQVGDVVVNLPTHEWARRIASHILTQHNQDGTHAAVTATSVTAPTVNGTSDIQLRSVSLETIQSETTGDFVASGLVWSISSGLIGTMTSGVATVSGKRLVVSAIATRTYTASKDTYVSLDNTSAITYTEVANGAAQPALPANSQWLAKVVTGASITSISDMRVLQGTPRNPYKFSVYRSSAQSSGAAAAVTVQFNTELFDSNNNYDNATNYRYTCPITGYYFFRWQVNLPAGSTDTVSTLMKNGVALQDGTNTLSSGTATSGTAFVPANAGDYFQVSLYTGSSVAIRVTSQGTNFSGYLVSQN